jgi:protein gp37
VSLNLYGAPALSLKEFRDYEQDLIVGASLDPMFGPVILFGQGGTAVEVIADRALALPPLNRPLAQALVESAIDECDRFYPAFQFVLWGGKTPREALEAAMVDAAGEA